ncbi:uncharacterized protein RJT21DRAFT_123193 [Scheffersomyces amazonensis]|uniref:uncharacterized protein n=1 Tax=Scheffersomyces amazonensis TaxID=1078765 RepID=UPI00315CDC6C
MYHFEVSRSRRLVQVGCAIFWCLLSGGPIFGFAALKPILINEHVYEYTCDLSINGTMTTPSPSPFYTSLLHSSSNTLTATLLGNFLKSDEGNGNLDGIAAKCTPQDLKLNFMFAVAAVLTNVSALAIGRVLDLYGPRVCGLVGALFLYLASFIFIYTKELEPYFDPYLIGYAFMALGGPFAYISSFQLSNSFPKNSGAILALVTGAFDASSAVFLIYKIYYIKSDGAFTLASFFKLYLFVPIFITIVQFAIMPSDSYKTPTDNTLCVDDEIDHHQHVHPTTSHNEASGEAVITSSVDETSPLLDEHVVMPSHPVRRDSIGDALKQPYVEEGEEFLIEHTGGVFGILHGYSAQFQINTPWFYLICLFSTIQMLRINYFVATIGTQYAYLFQSVTLADKLNKIFDIALPLGGVISIPFVGLFLDNCSTVTVLSGLLTVSLSIGILGLFGNYIAAVIGVLIFVGYRPLFYTTVSDFCAKVFGFETFGTVYGTLICISGIVNFGQSILDELTHTTFNMNPFPINISLVLITFIIGIITIIYVKIQARLFNEKKRREASNSSRQFGSTTA